MVNYEEEQQTFDDEMRRILEGVEGLAVHLDLLPEALSVGLGRGVVRDVRHRNGFGEALDVFQLFEALGRYVVLGVSKVRHLRIEGIPSLLEIDSRVDMVLLRLRIHSWELVVAFRASNTVWIRRLLHSLGTSLHLVILVIEEAWADDLVSLI